MVITHRSRIKFENWKNLLSEKFINEIDTRREIAPNTHQGMHHPIRFTQIINSIVWSDQPEGSLFWNDIGDFNFENIKELNDYLENVVMKQIIPYKKIKLIW